ncbi:pheromone-processing carboxypeptidase KEX1 [Aureobasidium subglaciale]|nr:pheromone-processing carboxypeptidase KEX1 [Aureobasidium subglaciale]KAI5276327.1 pheromone-processing carboxypeptidase KEX1 [Aureobasidium subglaciale]
MHLFSTSPRRRSQATWTGSLACGLLYCSSWMASAAAKQTAADYFVSSLPGAPEPLLKMHAGHIEITPEHHGNLFFWHYQNRHIANKQRTVLWLNGGPGCSSMDGAMMEIGPYRVKPDGNLQYNNGSWAEFANLLFVDQPVGTGFSYVDTDSYVHELEDASNQMVQFLEKFYDLFPEYKHDDLYIAGESYAGQYIPYLAEAILKRNAEKKGDKWSLAGLLIGNGWISTVDQSLSYLPYAKKVGLIKDGSEGAKKVEAQHSKCIEDLDKDGKNHVDSRPCEAILQAILQVSNQEHDLAQVKPYLRRKDVTDALHISPGKTSGWAECSGQVGNAFSARAAKPSYEILPALLEQVPILLFSGDKDLICNHIGTEELINRMEWNGGKGFETAPGVWAPRRDWTFESEPAGIWQEARNLTYVVFYNASHMVPFDWPRRSRDMLDRFMKVDIDSVGGTPTDSRIDGEKGPLTSVGGHPNSTAAEEAEKEALQQATWKAYYKSGEVALVVVVIAVAAWGYFIWRQRRSAAGYRGLSHNLEMDGMGLNAEGFRRKQARRDLEAADFDEAELDELTSPHNPERERFDVGDDSDDDDDDDGKPSSHPHGGR